MKASRSTIPKKNYPEIYKHQVDYMKKVRKNLEDLLEMYDA
jgi:hypothetical protein